MSAAVRAVVAAAVLVAVVAPRAHAQRISAGAGYAFGAYAEQGASLRFAGDGVAGHAAIGWRRFDLLASAARLAFEPEAAGEPFDLVQMDVRLRARLTKIASAEVGFLRRDVTPLHAAQSVGAVRIGALAAFPLAPGSDVTVRSAWLAGSAFSGGGAAPFAVEVGLGASYAPWSERVRITGDVEFQRFDRRTSTAGGRLDAPIQSTTARVGVTVVR
jgi:hypothetical protein